MSDRTSTARDLLIVAIQDLYAAEQLLAGRMAEPLGAARDAGIVQVFEDYRSASVARVEALASIAGDLDEPAQGAPNIWMTGVLDDAARDARTTKPGPLLDIALVGALRKGAHAARVSYETAIELAKGGDACAVLTAARDEHAATDTALARALVRIACLAD